MELKVEMFVDGSIMVHESVFRKVFNNRGFSLGELMAAMGVFAILAAIAVPQYLASQPARRLNGGARQILAKLMWARAEAVEKNTTYVVTFPTNHTYQIFNDTNGNSSVDVGEWNQTNDIQTQYEDVTFAVSGSTNYPTFNGRGTASNDTTITLSNSSGNVVVQVRPTGSVKIN